MNPFKLTGSVAVLCAAAMLSFSGCDKKEKADNGNPGGTNVAGTTTSTSVNQASLNAIAGAPAAAPASNNAAFNAVTSKLDAGGTFYLYLGTEQWLAGLASKMQPLKDMVLSMVEKDQPSNREMAAKASDMVLEFVRRSGLEEIAAVGISSLPQGNGGFQNKMFIHRKAPGQGLLWTVFGRKPHKLDALDWLPADTALGMVSDLDVTEIIRFVRDEIKLLGQPQISQQFEAIMSGSPQTGNVPVEKLLNSLAGAAGLVVTLDPNAQVTLPIQPQQVQIDFPRAAILLTVKDDSIFQQVETFLKDAPPGQVQRTDEGDLHLRSMGPIPINETFAVSPTLAYSAGKHLLVVASDPKLVRDLIEGKSPRLKGTPEFTALSQGLPTEGNSFSLVTRKFNDALLKVQRASLMGAAGELPPAVMRFLDSLMSQAGGQGGYQVSTQLDDGWLSWSRSSKSAATAAIEATVVAPVAVAAALALPAVTSAQLRAKVVQSQNNARQISLALNMYAIDHDGNFPATLSELTPKYLPDTSIFRSPFAPNTPVGYKYTSGLTENSPSNAVVLEDENAPAKARRTVVAYRDGHVESVAVR